MRIGRSCLTLQYVLFQVADAIWLGLVVGLLDTMVTVTLEIK